MAELEQPFIVDRKQRPLERSEYRQLIVRPLNRGESGADGLHFLAVVEGPAAYEQMRNPPRFDRIDVRACHVVAEVDETTEEQRDVAGPNWGALFLSARPGPGRR